MAEIEKYIGDTNKIVSSSYLYNTLQDLKENHLDTKVDKSEGYGLSQNDLTDTLKTSYDDATKKAHSHSNKTALDKITTDKIAAWDNKASSDHTHDNYANTVTVTGNGNAVTNISQDGNTINVAKDTTFLTQETSLSKGTITGSGNAVTDINVSNHQITLVKGSTFLTAHPKVTMGTDTTASASPAFGGSFSVISGITKDANGHQTAIEVKAITIPSLPFEATALDLSALI